MSVFTNEPGNSQSLSEKAFEVGLPSRFLVSTILPRDLATPLEQVLCHPQAVPYYSLYSVNPAFRKRWLPKALPAEEGLARLARFQQATGR